MKKTSIPLMLAIALAALAGCSASSSNVGSAQFAVSARQTLASNISRVSVTSSAVDIPSISVDLAPTQGLWGGSIGNIPVGTNRSFLAQAFDSSGTLLFEGTASGIAIAANQTTLVAITLQEINAPPLFQNEAPIIDALAASSTTVPIGGELSLVATAHDPNAGDTLSYAWSSTTGFFSAVTSTSTSWTAPATAGLQTLTFTVTDSGGLSSSISLRVNAIQGGGQGDALLSISFNSSPRVALVSASPTQLAVGQTAAVSVSAADPDGDSLTYAWSATCAGFWSQPSSHSAQFTPSARPEGVCNNCRLTVTVSDGHGGQTTGSVALCVGDAPSLPHLNPVILRSYRSADMAAEGQVLTYEVAASDPEGSTLSFSWAANTGLLGPAVEGASTSRITWTAPACAEPSALPTITATVTNAFNLTATRSFTVMGLPACSLASWAPTGAIAFPRLYHTSTLLPDGKVLITGGWSEYGTWSSAEVYDPASGTWSTTGSMAEPRGLHTSTLLLNGKVLVTGGLSGGNDLATAELYDPTTGTWSSAGSMVGPRELHTATLLSDGKVLVTGGRHHPLPLVTLATAEIYDPASNTWSAASAMATARCWHRATLLPNGKVLVSGGYDESNGGVSAAAEVYEPTSNTWSATGSMAESRYEHTSTLLPNGKVLVAGGLGGDGSTLATAEEYDPLSGTWSSTGSMSTPRTWSAVTLLPNGKVLSAGGFNWTHYELITAEVYDPASSTWSPTASMNWRRRFLTGTLLPNGKVLFAGGSGWIGNTLKSIVTAELYTP